MNSSADFPIADPCCIYGLNFGTEKYLVCALFPNAHRIPLVSGQNASAIIKELAPETRWFVRHVDLTFQDNVPPDRTVLSCELQRRSIILVNDNITDTSKRRLQSVLSQLNLPTTIGSPEGDPDELLFLKSNHNAGGAAEKRLPPEARDFFGVVLPHRLAPQFTDYQLAKRRNVLPKAFEIEDVFVERYVTNRANLFYRAFISFDAVVLSKIRCEGIIKKALEADYREDYFLSFSDANGGFASAPDEISKRIMTDLHRFCRAFELQLGAVDILMDDLGVPYIVDINPTAWGAENCDRSGFLKHLSMGLRNRAALTDSRGLGRTSSTDKHFS